MKSQLKWKEITLNQREIQREVLLSLITILSSKNSRPNGKKVNYNSQISLQPGGTPGPRTLCPALSKASLGLLIPPEGAGQMVVKTSSCLANCAPKYLFLCVWAGSPQDCKTTFLTFMNAWQNVYIIMTVVCGLFLHSAGIGSFVVLHRFMEMNHFMSGLFYCNPCLSNSPLKLHQLNK